MELSEMAIGGESFMHGDFAGALPFYQSALRRDPKEALLYFAVGFCQRQAFQYSKAIETFEAGLMHPGNDSAIDSIKHDLAQCRKDLRTYGDGNSNHPLIPQPRPAAPAGSIRP